MFQCLRLSLGFRSPALDILTCDFTEQSIAHKIHLKNYANQVPQTHYKNHA